MSWNIANRKAFLYLISTLVLLIGLGSAGFIYQTAENDANNHSGYEIIGGKLYPSTGNSKKYVHDLRLYGGEAAVIADQFNRWFAGLWQGRSFAYTVACIAIFIALGFFFAARYSSSLRGSDACKEHNHDA